MIGADADFSRALAQADIVGIIATAFDHWDSRTGSMPKPSASTCAVVGAEGGTGDAAYCGARRPEAPSGHGHEHQCWLSVPVQITEQAQNEGHPPRSTYAESRLEHLDIDAPDHDLAGKMHSPTRCDIGLSPAGPEPHRPGIPRCAR